MSLQLLTPWSFSSGSGVSHPGVALGIGEVGRGGCQAPQESPSGVSPRTARTHCDSEKLKARDGSSRATSAKGPTGAVCWPRLTPSGRT